MSTPLKRSKEIQPLSRDHHHALLLCWKIRTGLTKGISPQRISIYADWFYHSHLLPHFTIEESHVFPVLGNDHEHIRMALQQHQQLHALFTNKSVSENHLMQIQELLEQHIRFEERVLFPEIQQQASPEQLASMEQAHAGETFTDNLTDPFWN